MVRGRVSIISYRYAKGSIPYLPKDDENSFIMYLEENSLYGWAILQALP